MLPLHTLLEPAHSLHTPKIAMDTSCVASDSMWDGLEYRSWVARVTGHVTRDDLLRLL